MKRKEENRKLRKGKRPSVKLIKRVRKDKRTREEEKRKRKRE